ncbi:MAG: hypothetical protein ACT6XY_15185 [Phreatobacter sp.]|jgi:hypothetical protein|uniref:hypothetical protein n=1 Tax=Phreatobacter sp. TaxID=1966341 RepID=UPI004036B35B
MKLPTEQAIVPRNLDRTGSFLSGYVTPQGCNTLKKIACAAAVAGCLATPNPVACIMATAPHCADCL